MDNEQSPFEFTCIYCFILPGVHQRVTVSATCSLRLRIRDASGYGKAALEQVSATTLGMLKVGNTRKQVGS